MGYRRLLMQHLIVRAKRKLQTQDPWVQNRRGNNSIVVFHGRIICHVENTLYKMTVSNNWALSVQNGILSKYVPFDKWCMTDISTVHKFKCFIRNNETLQALFLSFCYMVLFCSGRHWGMYGQGCQHQWKHDVSAVPYSLRLPVLFLQVHATQLLCITESHLCPCSYAELNILSLCMNS
jgi:hypothetical protein